MGLFLGPFAGHAVGGGGHGVLDPPPPGTGDPGAGPRSEVDTTNRSPIRLLRTTMSKHKPKFMKTVPPGQQRGSLAPPYAWGSIERDDWAYDAPKRSRLNGLKEGEFSKAAPASPGGPSKPPVHSAMAHPKPVDPRHARVEAITQELKQLHQEMTQLFAQQKTAAAQGKTQSERIGKQFAPTTHPGEALERTGLRLIEAAAYTPLGIERDENDPPHPDYDAHIQPLPMRTKEQDAEAKNLRNLRSRGIPVGLRPQAPQASFELIRIHKEMAAKRARITALSQELKQLHMQMRQSHESTGLRSNNLRRLSLLLK